MPDPTGRTVPVPVLDPAPANSSSSSPSLAPAPSGPRPASPADRLLSRSLQGRPVQRVSTLEEVLDVLNRLRRGGDGLLPVVLVSLAPETGLPRVDVDVLATRIGDRARVLVMSSARMGFLLGERAPSWRCSGGAVRVYLPGGRACRPVVIRPGDDAGEAMSLVEVELTHGDALLWSSTGSRRPSGSEAAPHVSVPVPAPVQTCDHAEELSRLREEISSLKNENKSLERRLATASALLNPTVHSDAADQLRFEIGHHHLVSNPEQDRLVYPLRSYTFGADFLSSLDQMGQLATRDRVVAVVCDVLTRRAYEMPARSVHPHARAGRPGMVRDHDGAVAFRCAVKAESPGAARLFWWELTDGTVELGRVAHHDDYVLR